MSEQTWQARVFKLINEAEIHGNMTLISGDYTLTTSLEGILMSKGSDKVQFHSMEIDEAWKKKRYELWCKHLRSLDEANIEAIERILA